MLFKLMAVGCTGFKKFEYHYGLNDGGIYWPNTCSPLESQQSNTYHSTRRRKLMTDPPFHTLLTDLCDEGAKA